MFRRKFARKASKPRRFVRRRGAKRRGTKRPLNANRMDRATVIETQELTATPEGGNYVGHQLSQYNRALAVSKNYRFYRCKKWN